MRKLKQLLWTHLANDYDLITKLGSSDRIKVSYQPSELDKPAVTFQVSTDNKKIPDVHEIKAFEIILVAWSIVGDAQCLEIADILYESLDGEIDSDANVRVYDSEVTPIVGPYYDEAARSWRADVTLNITARLK